jgi:trk system potassium uptake protein TrkH
MQKLVLLRLMAAILGVSALLMIPALITAAVLGEAVRSFAIPLGGTLVITAPVIFLVRTGRIRLSPREGFLMVFLAWVFSSLLGALPYVFSPRGLSFTDSLFESACAFATTGGTTIRDIEALPRSLLLWRSMSHWFGGMGIVLLSVALMPLFGVGGFQLIKAEAPGPEKEKITPRIAATAKMLWMVYTVLTLVLVILYRLGGMDFFDALCHGLAIMATGGVSTKNRGLAFFNSPFIEGVTTIFMLLSALNFNLYFRLLKGKFGDLLRSTELRVYFSIFFIAAAVITLNLLPLYGSLGESFRYASYHAASILTTTGGAVADYETWPALTQGILFCLMFIGGCSASTAGGIKVIRCAVLFKQAGNEIRRLLYPLGVFSIQLNKKVGRRDVVYGVAGFVFLYLLTIALTTMAAAFSGIDLFSSFSAALAVLGNVGQGFGAVGPSQNYAAFAAPVKWFYSLVMIAGRLELWTVVVLFTPAYWRR